MAGETLHEERSELGPEILDRHRAISTIMEELGSIGTFSVILFYRVSALPALLIGLAVAILIQLPLKRATYLAGAFLSGLIISAVVLSARIAMRGDNVDLMILLICSSACGLAALFCAVLLQALRHEQAGAVEGFIATHGWRRALAVAPGGKDSSARYSRRPHRSGAGASRHRARGSRARRWRRLR